MKKTGNNNQQSRTPIEFNSEQIKQILLSYASNQSREEFYKVVFESLMKAEREIFKQKHNDVSNGYRKRTRVVFDGMVLQLRIPRVRKNNFYPTLLEILMIQEQQIAELSVLLYSNGLSDSQISQVLEYLYGHKYTPARISQMVSFVKEDLQRWRNRKLDSYYTIIYIDAIFLSSRNEVSMVKDNPFYLVLGVKTDGRREVLSIEYLPTESRQGWELVFEGLKRRGLERVDLVVSDALPGIELAVAKHFSGAAHQFCVAHLKRRVVARVASNYKKQMSEDLKTVFRTDLSDDNSEKGWLRWKKFIQKWKDKYPWLKSMLDYRYRHYFVYLDYNVKIRSMIYTTNWIERLNKTIRNRFKNRYPMPSIESTIDLITLVVWDYEPYKHPVSALFAENEKFNWKSGQ